MKSLLRYAVLFSALFCAALTAYPQELISNQPSAISNTEEGAKDDQPIAEEHRKRKIIRLDSEGRLSVDVEEMELRELMITIAAISKFQVEIDHDLGKRKVTTAFKNMPIEKGLLRILSLVRQKTYSIDYGPDGRISSFIIPGSDAPQPKAPDPKTQVVRPKSRKAPSASQGLKPVPSAFPNPAPHATPGAGNTVPSSRPQPSRPTPSRPTPSRPTRTVQPPIPSPATPVEMFPMPMPDPANPMPEDDLYIPPREKPLVLP